MTESRTRPAVVLLLVAGTADAAGPPATAVPSATLSKPSIFSSAALKTLLRRWDEDPYRIIEPLIVGWVACSA